MSQPKITDTALDQYALTPPVSLFPLLRQGNSNTTIGVRTGASDFILKIYSGYDDPSRLKSEHELLAWLQQQRLSFAVPAPLRTKAGATMAFSGLGWQALTPFFPGSRVDPEHSQELESFGGALGELLSAFERFPLRLLMSQRVNSTSSSLDCRIFRSLCQTLDSNPTTTMMR
jgi:Ser/Thr protein kinase RdoA (MazF antagonist)